MVAAYSSWSVGHILWCAPSTCFVHFKLGREVKPDGLFQGYLKNFLDAPANPSLEKRAVVFTAFL
jgi:hypothetical protein